MKQALSLLAAVALAATTLTIFSPATAQAATWAVAGQDVMSPANYVAKGSSATTNPQGAPVSALSAQTAAMVDTLPDRYLNDFWKGRLKTSTNRENFTIPIYTVDSSQPDANWVSVQMQSYALYPDIHPVMEGKATASATGGTYGFEITPLPTTAPNYGKVVIPAHAVPGGPIPGGDKSMTVVDIATGTVRGYYVADKQADGSWKMGGGYLTTLNSPNATNWFDQNEWLKAERGTSSVGGVMNEFLMAGAEEIAAGSIDHVTSWTFPSTKAGEAMWPAYQTDGKLSEAHAPKMGQRFWIPDDPATNAQIATLGLSSFEQVVVKNLQEYGGIVTDQNFWTMALNLQHPVTYTAQGKPNPYLPGGIVHNAHGNVDLINKIPWTLTKWGEIDSSTQLPQAGEIDVEPTAEPSSPPEPSPTTEPEPTPTSEPSATPEPTSAPTPTPGTAERIGSANTYANAVTASTKFNRVGGKLVIASGDSGVEALLGGTVAAKIGGGLLLTKPDELPANVAAEVKRLKPSAIFIIGEISADQRGALERLTPRLEVTGNADRLETSLLVAKRYFPNAPSVYVANGSNQSEVANAAARASLTKEPVILTAKTQTTASFKAYFATGKVTTARAIGTSTSISSAVVAELQQSVPGAIRINVSEVFTLNANLLTNHASTGAVVGGYVFASSAPASADDVFVAMIVSARTGYPVVFVKQNCVPKVAGALVSQTPSANSVLIGTTTELASGMHTRRCA